MGDGYGKVMVFATLCGLATVAGIYLVLRQEKWARRHSTWFISFAAGTLLAAAFGHLLPEALELGRGALWVMLASFFAFYILERNIAFHYCREEGCEHHPIGLTSVIALGFHSLLDGVIIGTGFEVSASLGVIATLGVVSHEVPEGISSISILLHSGYSKARATAYSWAVALATPLGALVAYPLLRHVSGEILSPFLAVAAGSFLYIAASDLIPETHRDTSWVSVFLVLGGAAMILAVGTLLG